MWPASWLLRISKNSCLFIFYTPLCQNINPHTLLMIIEAGDFCALIILILPYLPQVATNIIINFLWNSYKLQGLTFPLHNLHSTINPCLFFNNHISLKKQILPNNHRYSGFSLLILHNFRPVYLIFLTFQQKFSWHFFLKMIYYCHQLKEPSSTDGKSGMQTTGSRRFVEADRLGSIWKFQILAFFYRMKQYFCSSDGLIDHSFNE